MGVLSLSSETANPNVRNEAKRGKGKKTKVPCIRAMRVFDMHIKTSASRLAHHDPICFLSFLSETDHDDLPQQVCSAPCPKLWGGNIYFTTSGDCCPCFSSLRVCVNVYFCHETRICRLAEISVFSFSISSSTRDTGKSAFISILCSSMRIQCRFFWCGWWWAGMVGSNHDPSSLSTTTPLKFSLTIDSSSF